MSEKLNVFVSSVQKELEDERVIVQNLLSTDAFLSAHCSPVLYEFAPASPDLLRDRIREKIAAAFELGKSSSSFQVLRGALSQRCEALVINIRDMDLKAFCLRLLDSQLPEPDWLESVGSYVSNTPPVRWKDEDETLGGGRLLDFQCAHG